MAELEASSRSTPYVAKINPSGPLTINAFHAAGGVPAVMRSLLSQMHGDCMTVSGQTIRQVAENAVWSDKDIIRPADSPIAPEGGLRVLQGSLAPDYAIVKSSAVDKAMWKHRGPTRVFESMEDAIVAVEAKKVAPGSVIVIRHEGPVGGPGMRAIMLKNHVTHPEFEAVLIPLDVQEILMKKGAFFERCFAACNSDQRFPLAELADQIKRIGWQTTVLASDFGQADNLRPIPGLERFLTELARCGIPDTQLEKMVKDNPAARLGI